MRRIGTRWSYWQVAMLSGAGLACLTSLWATAADPGARKPGDTQQAQKLVEEGLHLGMLGDRQRRDEMLAAAVAADADFAPARWAQGQVQASEGWLSAQDQSAALQADQKLEAYRARRDEASDSIEDQWELAQWCMSRGMEVQAKAHLSQILVLDPNYVPARQALGHQQINNRWVTPEMIVDATERATADAIDYQEFQGRVERLAERLSSESEAVRAKALEDLVALQDPRSAVAMEVVLGNFSEPAALAMVQVVGQWQELRATEALARQSIVSPWPSVRAAAAQALQGRQMIDYVPSLLAEFQMPTSVQVQATPIAPNRLLYREVLVSENQEQANCMVRDTAMRRLSNGGGNGMATLNDMMRDMQRERMTTNMEVNQANGVVQARNSLITQTLNSATGQNLENDPRTWWNWWNELNGIQMSGKQVAYNYQIDTATYVDSTPTSTGATSGSGVSQAPTAGECLAAGTVVLTDRGLIGIESIKVGDQVLAQEIETGALEFRPVLRCTVRDPSELFEIRVGQEWIRCSGGHPFWVAGSGWILAKELQAGMMLHAQSGDLPILEIRRGDVESTYNLVVDGFATYFAGENQVLVHDFTNRRPSRELVPGLNP